MPKTRPAVSREAKVEEILEVSERRLREGGYWALSVAAIARELGLAQNAIYWYFPSKDDLFVAAMERMLTGIGARKPAKRVDTIERILWFTDQLAELSDLRAAMSERARESEAVADFIERLDTLLSRMLSNVLSNQIPEARLGIAVDTFRATAEGTYVRGLDKRSRRRVLRFSLQQLLRPSDG